MKKYLINNREITRKAFFASLRQDCSKVISTTVIAGWCGVDISRFDEKHYRRCLRRLRQGHVLCFLDKGRSYSLK